MEPVYIQCVPSIRLCTGRDLENRNLGCEYDRDSSQSAVHCQILATVRAIIKYNFLHRKLDEKTLCQIRTTATNFPNDCDRDFPLSSTCVRAYGLKV